MPPTSESHWSSYHPVVMSSGHLMTYGGVGTSTSSPELSPPSTSTDGCAVCGDRVNGKRYGAPACLGCIVFFRRAVTNDVTYKCLKGGTCVITNESRCICRFCRLQKCYTVGMKASAIQRRDVMGPRKPKKEIKQEVDDSTPNLKCISNPSSTSSMIERSPLVVPRSRRVMDALLKMQRYQIGKHPGFFAAHEATNLDGDLYAHLKEKVGAASMSSCSTSAHSHYLKLNGQNHRRARANDVNCMLKVGLIDAATWGNQFDFFKKMKIEDKKRILTEYGFTFMLVDQGYKTAQRATDGFWFLQNGTFMHEDYFLGLPEEDARSEMAATKAKLHPLFVNESLNCVGYPFRTLQIDEFECAVLKTFLLLTQQGVFKENIANARQLSNDTMHELMEYEKMRCPETAIERFGTIILLTSTIRCSVNVLYNQTRVSDVFDLMKFDPLVRDVLLSSEPDETSDYDFMQQICPPMGLMVM